MIVEGGDCVSGLQQLSGFCLALVVRGKGFAIVG